jgi:hypothetical protein
LLTKLLHIISLLQDFSTRTARVNDYGLAAIASNIIYTIHYYGQVCIFNVLLFSITIGDHLRRKIMRERLSNTPRKRLSAGALGISLLLSAAGCSSYSNAANTPIRACKTIGGGAFDVHSDGSVSYKNGGYVERDGKSTSKPVINDTALEQTSAHDITELRKRTENAGGGISIYDNYTADAPFVLKAAKNGSRLSVELPTDGYTNSHDVVNFGFNGSEQVDLISTGTLVCVGTNGNQYPNQVYYTIVYLMGKTKGYETTH